MEVSGDGQDTASIAKIERKRGKTPGDRDGPARAWGFPGKALVSDRGDDFAEVSRRRSGP
jgi:hypothetical protein